MTARSSDGEALVIQQAFDPEDHVDVLLAIQAVPAWTLHRLQHRKFGLPVTQDEGLQIRQPTDFADAIEPLLGGGCGLCRGCVARHVAALSGGGRRYRSSFQRNPIEVWVRECGSRDHSPPRDFLSRLRRRWMKRTGVPVKSNFARS